MSFATDFSGSIASDMDLSGGMNAADDTLALLVSDADDLDISFLNELLQQGQSVPEPLSPPPSVPSEGETAGASPAGLSNGVTTNTDSSSNSGSDGAPSPTLPEADYGLASFMESVLKSQATPAPTSPTSAVPPEHAATQAAVPIKTEGDDGKATTEERKAKRRAQVAISARRHRSRKKNEMINLKKEVNYLNYQLDFLRSKHKLLRADGAVAEWEEKAIAQRHKRRQAEELNDQLRHALFVQTGYVRNLKLVFSLGSPLNAEINMRRYLHTYTHLRKDPASRARDFASICTESKLDMAKQTVLRETEGIPFLSPHISTRQITTSSTEFGATTVAVYAFDTMNMTQIFLAACGAILGCGSTWPNYTQLDSYGQVMDAPSDSVRYGVSGCRYRSDVEGDEEVAVESRGLSFYRVSDGCGVLVWDYADDDDLYPMQQSTLVKRDVIGCVVVRLETCEDGVERVVCRSICTKVHSVKMPTLSPDIHRFAQSKKQGAQICGSMVYETIKGDCPGVRPVVA